ncbi:hypothetical protein NFI96_006268 [Prochilodus magdalenae]|nr:hypothetical protein NFI96_006268 [Prochilodus magdalenae]
MKPVVLWFCVFAVGTAQFFAWPDLTPHKAMHCNVTGKWRSELGSMLQLVSTGQEVRGVYRTAVETVRGASGQNQESKVLGLVGDGPQPTIAFSVLWVKGGLSLSHPPFLGGLGLSFSHPPSLEGGLGLSFSHPPSLEGGLGLSFSHPPSLP